MDKVLPLLKFLLAMMSGWIHRLQLMVIELIKAENRALKERRNGHRIMFIDAERALRARKVSSGRVHCAVPFTNSFLITASSAITRD